jgi:hypothetical protein
MALSKSKARIILYLQSHKKIPPISMYKEFFWWSHTFGPEVEVVTAGKVP